MLLQERAARLEAETELQELREAMQAGEEEQRARLESLEQKVEQAQAMAKDANRSKSLFLCNISHEVRTPLNGILGMASLLAETRMNAQQGRFLSSLNRSAESLLSILNDVLDYSKIVGGSLYLEESLCDPREMLQTLVDIVSDSAKEKGLKLRLSVDSEVPHRLVLDRNRVGQIVMNLLNNAVKFSEMGEIRVEACRCESYLEIKVSDTGQGISRENKERVFEVFYQSEDKVNNLGGTGLGLALCKGLVELMDGSIHLDTELGRGSRFTVMLPLIVGNINSDEAIVVDPESRGFEPGRISTLSILVVEDNEINQLYAATVLESAGHIVTLANNGLEGVKSTRRIRPDLILMDLQMPEMDGFEATRQIRSEEVPGKRIPILALTAQGTAADRQLCAEVGMDGYLTKPIKKDLLLEAVSYYARQAEGAEVDEDTREAIRNLAARLNDIEDVQLLGRLFSRRYPNHCRSIERALHTKEPSQVLQAASGLKGSFLSFEFTEGIEMVRNLERLVSKRKWSQALLLAPLLYQLCADLEEQITNYLPTGREGMSLDKPAHMSHEAGLILLVDDEETNRLIGRRMLERQGHRVLEAVDGAEAVQMVKRHEVDVVVMDVVMPNLNGIEACRQIKQNLRMQHIPVILITSLEDENERLAGIEAGADDYIGKPLRGKETFVRIRNAIRFKKLFSDLDDKYEKLRDLEELRGSLGHMLVHDMRGALSGIIGYAQLLLMDGPQFRGEHRSLIRQIEISSMMLNEMMSSVIDVSKIETASLPLNLAQHDLCSLVEREVRFYGELPDANIFLHKETRNKVSCDSSLIRRVVTNLLTNALKHSGSGELIEVAVVEGRDAFKVTVTDNGPGIPEHLHQKIFDKFTQIHGESGPKPYSSGLGLTFCKLVVESHGGTIGVVSRPGKGSSFWFKLPKVG